MDEAKSGYNVAKRKVEFIRESIGEDAALLQLIEEAGEVVQAAAKLPRAFGVVPNPTPVTEVEATKKFEEELVDLVNALWVLGYDPYWLYMKAISRDNIKLDRCIERIKEAQKDE